jgi:hypothetical protein
MQLSLFEQELFSLYLLELKLGPAAPFGIRVLPLASPPNEGWMERRQGTL